jgi:hypothetical protein
MASKYNGREVRIVQEVTRGFLERAKVGRKSVYKNMAMFPLPSDLLVNLLSK